ncbi:MAG: YHYH protein [Deltaproteobacteria bacterium]|nr:YHYH protein [Deltaproteobacteria bacterium]
MIKPSLRYASSVVLSSFALFACGGVPMDLDAGAEAGSDAGAEAAADGGPEGLAEAGLDAAADAGQDAGPAPGSTAGIQCDYNVSVMNSSPSVNALSTSRWTCTGTQRLLAANGIPDHPVVARFPNMNNPNAITVQTVTAAYTLTPTMGTMATQLGGPRGAVGHVLNGVKMDPSTAGSCDNAGNCSAIGNSGPWSLEALGSSGFNFGTDENNAHVQPGGVYHYHGMPEGFVTVRGGGPTQMTLIGWAADGFAIYARYGHSVATDARSPLRAMRGSYQFVSPVSAMRPSTTLYPMGTFQQDYVYVAGSGDLDECNGRVGATPEFPAGIYHYYATDTYPFMQRCVRGMVTAGGGGMMPPPMGDGGLPPPPADGG